MVRVLRGVALSGFFSLFILIVLRYCWLARPQQLSPWLPLAVMLIPLMLPLHGLLAGHRNTYKWSGFIALAYVAYAVDSLFIDGWSRILGVAEALASLSWFFCTALYVRQTREEPGGPQSS
ncbi:MAG: DUF2069 domain-containing protein [Gammaproteobacteria bacterium]|nr:DUF2069 domain-containing protein [Gammaproteobacteria bacterium]